MTTLKLTATAILSMVFVLPVAAEMALRANVDVNVRTGPGTGYAVMGVARAGQGYAGISSSNGWWKICWDGRTGWTSGSLWSVVSGQSGVKVAVSSANVRSGPGTGYAIVGHAYAGQVYRYDSYNGWYRIWFGGAQRWIAGSIATRVSLAGGTPPPPPPPSPSTLTNLPMIHRYQPNGYWCVPTSAWMVIRYISGRDVYLPSIAWWMGTTTKGTLNYKSAAAVTHYTGQPYGWVYYSRAKVVYNINRNKPHPAPMNMRFIAFAHRSINVFHHVVIKGYTSGGYWIHDPAWGPNKWASTTEVNNTFRYWDPKFGARY